MWHPCRCVTLTVLDMGWQNGMLNMLLIQYLLCTCTHGLQKTYSAFNTYGSKDLLKASTNYRVSCRDTSENVYSSLIRILPSLSVFLPRVRTRVHASFFVSICSPLSSRTWRTDKDARSCESAPEVASRHACPWLNSSSEYRWQLVRRLPDGSMVCTVCVCVCVCVCAV